MGILNQQMHRLDNWWQGLMPEPERAPVCLFVNRHDMARGQYIQANRCSEAGFPVRLAAQSGRGQPQHYDDFALDFCKGELFIATRSILPLDTILDLHFYIPPQEKLLAACKGEIDDTERFGSRMHGMHVTLFDRFESELLRFRNYLEGKQDLLSIRA